MGRRYTVIPGDRINGVKLAPASCDVCTPCRNKLRQLVAGCVKCKGCKPVQEKGESQGGK